MMFTTRFIPVYVLVLLGFIYFGYQIYASIGLLPLEWQRFIFAVIFFKIMGIVAGLVARAEVRYIQRSNQLAYLEELEKLAGTIAEGDRRAAIEVNHGDDTPTAV